MESYHTARELIREMAFDEGIPVEDLLKSEYLAKSDIELFRKVKKKNSGCVVVIQCLTHLDLSIDDFC